MAPGGVVRRGFILTPPFQWPRTRVYDYFGAFKGTGAEQAWHPAYIIQIYARKRVAVS
jgi:hypothetical protein